MADPEGADVPEGDSGVAQRGGGLAVGGGGERLHGRDERPVLGVFADPQVIEPGEGGLGDGGIAAQRRQPGPVAGQKFDVGEAVSVGGLGQLGLRGVPVAGHQQRLD